jgi:hypothetical protein
LPKALSDCAVHSGSERNTEKNRRVDRPVEPTEGTYLEISKSGDTYEIRIKDLDKVQTYRGTATSDGISFKRNGKAETIRSGNGERTGMKWLADKKDCLVIRKSEGYCRD